MNSQQPGERRDIYVDHAANERTFLAWIRTALSIVAVALVLGKLDIGGVPSRLELLMTDTIAAIGLFVAVGATVKYRQVRTRINTGKEPDAGLPLLDMILAFAIVAMIVALTLTRWV